DRRPSAVHRPRAIPDSADYSPIGKEGSREGRKGRERRRTKLSDERQFRSTGGRFTWNRSGDLSLFPSKTAPPKRPAQKSFRHHSCFFMSADTVLYSGPTKAGAPIMKWVSWEGPPFL